MLELVAAFICLTSLLTYVNFRFIGLPPTIGVMVTALMFSLLLQGLSFLGYPGLEERVQELIGQIDFGDLLMNWMLSFLLFAGALHVNLSDLRRHANPRRLAGGSGATAHSLQRRLAAVVDSHGDARLCSELYRPVRVAHGGGCAGSPGLPDQQPRSDHLVS